MRQSRKKYNQNEVINNTFFSFEYSIEKQVY